MPPAWRSKTSPGTTLKSSPPPFKHHAQSAGGGSHHPILRVSSSRHDHPEPEDWFRGIPNSETPEASPVVRQSQKRACPPSAIASSLPEAHSSFFQGIYFGKFEFKGSDDGHHFQVQVYLDDLDSGGQAAESQRRWRCPDEVFRPGPRRRFSEDRLC